MSRKTKKTAAPDQPVAVRQYSPDEIRQHRTRQFDWPPFQSDFQLPQTTQRDDKWFAERLKYTTASEVDRLLMDDKCIGKSELFQEKVVPWIKKSSFVNEAMQFGIDNESLALYLAATELGFMDRVRTCMFCVNPANPTIGGSPDAVLVDQNEKATDIIEIKCPGKIYTKLPKRYLLQITTYMGVLGVGRCYLVQFSRTFQLHIMQYQLDVDSFSNIVANSKRFMTMVHAQQRVMEIGRLAIVAFFNMHSSSLNTKDDWCRPQIHSEAMQSVHKELDVCCDPGVGPHLPLTLLWLGAVLRLNSNNTDKMVDLRKRENKRFHKKLKLTHDAPASYFS